MKIWQVTEDLGDGDVAIRNFRTLEAAEAYMEIHEESIWHESNPHELDTDSIRFREIVHGI